MNKASSIGKDRLEREMNLSKLALVFVMAVDVMGQGLAFPIFNTLMTSPGSGLLPADTSAAVRQLDYGVVIGVFFLTWFLGAVYISRVSDSIGRKAGILICLTGALLGYALTIVAVIWNSFWLLLLSRAITGFTSGNQPIAQAAMVDMSRDEMEKVRNMGLIVAGFSAGLIGGPIIGAVFASPDFPGASLVLPFYVGGGLIALAMLLIGWFFEEPEASRTSLRIEPLEVVILLWEVTRRPTILRISAPYLLYMMGFMIFYVFFDDLLSSRYGLGTGGTSLGMLVLGITTAFASLVALPVLSQRASRLQVLILMTAMEMVALIILIGVRSEILAFAMIGLMGGAHAIAYPTYLNLFSPAAPKTEQGWVMGVSTALFTLAAAMASFIAGIVSEESLNAVFLVGFGGLAVALLLTLTIWRAPGMRELAAARA